MSIFENFEKKLQAEPKSIVFTEGTDARILSAASRLLAGKTLKVILLGEVEAVKKAAADGSFDITGAEIIDPANYEGFDEMVAKMVELRKGKMTEEECRAALKKGNYFGTMLVAMGEADALLGGATYSTADTVRPALQLVKTKPGNKIVSSCFILVRPSATGDNDVLAMGDCAINIKPNEDELVEIAVETAKCAKIFGIDPKVAFLSYSTFGSGKGEDVDKMRNACEKAKAAGARRALRLPVGGAFHSPLMEPAKQELEKAINEAPFQTPTCPIYQNVDAKPYTDPAAIKANLIAQLTAPVRWTYIVKNMLADGVTEFTELGPGTVLQGLIKKVDASAAVESKSTL